MSPLSFLQSGLKIIDVRSPAEYARGHIPEALSLPLFSDEERVSIGTLYKQSGHDEAVLEGLRIVGPKLVLIVEEATRISPEKFVAVHCWRGGMRSGSVAWLLQQAGFTVEVLDGGYKAYRHWVQQQFARALPLIVIGGPTGSGKTSVLHALSAIGEQVIDLEALARHKGSSFGALGELPQPAIEQFENALVNQLQGVDYSKAVWIEDESRKIGKIYLHPDFWEQLNSATLINIEIPFEQRLDKLVEDYGVFSSVQLAESIIRIRKRLGPQHVKSALEALENQDLRSVAATVLNYYDKAYRYSQTKRLNTAAAELVFAHSDAGRIAEELVRFEGGKEMWKGA